MGSGSGKTSVVKTLAQLCGHELRVLSVNAAMDTIEILGGFEQVRKSNNLFTILLTTFIFFRLILIGTLQSLLEK